MRAYVGVTDGYWYQHLAARPHLREANFWRPSATGSFRALSIGEPFLFKSHAPHNRLVGGGIFSGYAVLRASEAWDFFGEGNGADSFDGMRSRIARYRRIADLEADPTIGCVFVRDTTFFPLDSDEPAPGDFARTIVQGKGYELDALDADHPVARAAWRVLAYESDLGVSQGVDGPIRGSPVLTVPRLGQGSFKALVLTSYERRCAITGDKITPVLQAAHIKAVSSGGEHLVSNGVLLRSDAHTLFDRGYLTIDLAWNLRVSPRLRLEFGNGEEFYARDRTPVALPSRRADRPAKEFLNWHNDMVFQSS